VADYSVDIAVAVKGSQQLKKLRTEISNTSKELTVLNKLANKQSKTLPNSFQTLNKLVKQVKNNFDKAAIGTKRYNDAAKQLVNVEAKYNNELRKRERLLNKLRQQRPFETVQGKNVMASREARKGSGFADFSRSVTEKADLRRVENNTSTTAKKTSRMAALLAQQAAASNFDRLGGGGGRFFNNLGFGRNANEQGMFAMRGGRGARFRGGAQSAMIGGGFPLLFGSGVPGAIAGGIGGAVGGALAPGGGFAGSILATAVVAQTQKVMAFRKEVKEMNMAIKATGNESIISRKKVKELAKELKISPEEALEKLKEFDPVRFGGDTVLALETAFGNAENLELVSGLKDTDSLIKAIVKARSFIGEEASIELLNQLKTNDALDIELKLLNKILEVNKRNRNNQSRIPLDMQNINKLISRQNLFKAFVDNMNDTDPGDPRGLMLRREKSYTSVNEQYFFKSLTDDAIKRLEKFGGIDKLKEDFFTFLTEQDRSDYTELKGKVTEFFNIIDQNNEKLEFLAEFKAPAQEIETLLNPMRQVLDLSRAIKTGFEDSFKGIIKGTMTVSDAFRTMLNRIADYFLDTAARLVALQVQKSFLGLFSNMFTLQDPNSVFDGFNRKPLIDNDFLEGKANGGPVAGGKPYIVGERGPELFTPGTSGMITPNHALGGGTNVVVNVDASGSSIEGDEDRGRELGRLISVAVQSELVQQKRPGGLLA